MGCTQGKETTTVDPTLVSQITCKSKEEIKSEKLKKAPIDSSVESHDLDDPNVDKQNIRNIQIQVSEEEEKVQ